MTAESLFAECIIPGCTQPVADELTPCQTCRTIFGPMLQEADRPPELHHRRPRRTRRRHCRRLPHDARTTYRGRARRPGLRTRTPHSRTRENRSTRTRRSRKSQPDLLALRRTTNLPSPPPRVGVPPVPQDPLTHGPSRTLLTAPARAAATSATPLRAAATARPAENRTRRSGCAAQAPPPTTSRRESQRPPVHERHR